MPVLILGGNEDLDIIRPLAEKLVADGGEVRCYLEEDDYELRSIGCKIAVGPLNDEMNIEGALTGVHTFIPLLPDPLLLDAASINILPDLAVVYAAAAGSAGVVQMIVPIPGLADFPGPIGEVYRHVEKTFEAIEVQPCILRTGILWGSERPLPGALRGSGRLGRLDIEISALPVEGLVEVLAALDDHEEVHGRRDYGGEPMTLRALTDLAGAGPSFSPSPVAVEILEAGLQVDNRVEELGADHNNPGIS